VVALGQALVHVEEIAGPDVRLFAALGPTDLDDHVLAVVGVTWHEQLPELALQTLELALLLVHLDAQVVAHLRVLLGRQELPGVVDVRHRRAVRAVPVDDRLQLGVPTTGSARGGLVARRVDLGQARLELLELGLQVGEVLEHRARVPSDRSGALGDDEVRARRGTRV
jgi:hypothetical protein